jgi:hypothetical protein
MKTRNAILLLSLVLASCTTKNENSALVITKVIPPTATVSTVGATQVTSCAFDPAAVEFTFLPFNPAENQGEVAAVVTNNMPTQVTVNAVLRTDSNVFLPHQAVVTYEVVGGGSALPTVPNVVPANGLEVPSAGGSAPVGFLIFNGINAAAIPAGTFVRTYFHIEGKLLDGSTVHTSEREYLFRICHTTGCGTAGSWGICL